MRDAVLASALIAAFIFGDGRSLPALARAAGTGTGGSKCVAAQPPNSDGHSPDYDCMSSGCHGTGSAVAGLLITVSGTLHAPGDGAPVGGATVFVTDANGKRIELVTSATGIFWSGTSNGSKIHAGPQGTCASGTCSTYASAGALRAVTVSKCPDGPVSCKSPNSGRCASCHAAGQAAQQSVHLP